MKISILGYGWLGQEVYSKLAQKNIEIKASVTTPEKKKRLKENGINAIHVNLPYELKELKQLLDCQSLLVNFPPKIRTQDKLFEKKIDALIESIKNSTVSNIIFISSTSVYGDNQGKVDEDTPPAPSSNSGKKLLWAENELLKMNKNTLIVRPSGLIGKDRNPKNFFKSGIIPNPNAPVNLVHLEDISSILCHLLTNDLKWPTYLTISYPTGLTKGQYYQAINPCFTLGDQTTQDKKVTSKYMDQFKSFYKTDISDF